MGADYLECDLQKTKDGVILALHDESLLRTTDVEVIYPDRKNDYTSKFTYDELLKLDIGSWFNEANPEQARKSFVGQDILTLDDVLMIAEGYRIKRDENGKRIVKRDPDGNYLETEYEKGVNAVHPSACRKRENGLANCTKRCCLLTQMSCG